MPYVHGDPRADLTAPATTRPVPRGPAAPPEYFELSTIEPDEVSLAGTRSWIVRSQTAVVVYSNAVAGEELSRTGQPDEYMVVLVSTPTNPAAQVDVITDGERHVVREDAVIVIPPGDSDLVVTSTGVVVRVFSNRAGDLAERARNAPAHADAHPHTAPFAEWPPAAAGQRVRVYRLADAPEDPTRFGNIYRCATAMVNVIAATEGPRDATALSPHHHDDFEQISLQIDGEFVHHIRTPWTTNSQEWRGDEHRHCASPAIVVIPPPTIHTSQGVGRHRHQLIDIFCPPRRDFSERAGWVLNHDDYPELPAIV